MNEQALHYPTPGSRALHDDRQRAARAAEGHESVTPGDIAVGVIIGRTSEFFDFFTYGIASVLVFPHVFFPFADALTGTMYSFAIFALAFIFRPFGTALFMTIQRHWGRGVKLTIALFLLGTATAGIAFLPAHATSGGLAILLLAIFRSLQGVAYGGSWDGLPSLLALNAPANKRGWYSMLGQLSAPLGFLVAAALFLYLHTTLSEADFLEWGWRFPFYVAFAINVVGLFARLRLVLASEYTQMLEDRELNPIGTLEMVRTQGYNLFIGAFASLASYALFHLVTIFPLSWIAIHHSQAIADVLIIQLVGAAIAIPSMLASGAIADRLGRRTTLGLLAILIGVFAIASPWLLSAGVVGQDAFILVGFALLGLSYGQASGTATANFLPHCRYTGAALTADLAWLIGAAFAPLVALGLSAHFGLAALSLYLLSGSACTLLALRINRRIRPAQTRR
ncbi:MFS transporter [Allopusillimonas ginsengisoli]|uniref:MFS transporter n=1 Tax=Allopusillimonas ginsengisoli TaxID=453575 RepID=UPI001020EA5B|nr:MFS transporter [Allopusillimonas ginsengisoli]TEA78974.1 MFS transporter [Allopusillimonas ginsengisoli]